jgi:hypothetical protein
MSPSFANNSFDARMDFDTDQLDPPSSTNERLQLGRATVMADTMKQIWGHARKNIQIA